MRKEILKKRYLDIIIIAGLLTITLYCLFKDGSSTLVAGASIVSVFIELWNIFMGVATQSEKRSRKLYALCGYFVLVTVAFAVILVLILIGKIEVSTRVANALSLFALTICLPTEFYKNILVMIIYGSDYIDNRRIVK